MVTNRQTEVPAYPRKISELVIKRVRIINIQELISELNAIKKEGIWIILVNPEIYWNSLQVKTAVMLALRDFLQRVNRAKKFEIQVLLRLTGKNQISEVTSLNQFIEGEEYIAIIISESHNTLKFVNNLKSLKILNNIREDRRETDRILRFYGIGEKELLTILKRIKDQHKAIELLIIERMALNYFLT